MFRARRGLAAAAKEQEEHQKDAAARSRSPMEELNQLLDELENLVDTSLDDYFNLQGICPPPREPKSKRASIVDSLKKLRRSATNGVGVGVSIGNAPQPDDTTPAPSTPSMPSMLTVDIPPETPEEDEMPETSRALETPKTPKTPGSTSSSTTPSSSFLLEQRQRQRQRQRQHDKNRNNTANFLPMSQERVDHVVENIRRVAELVVIGERAAASALQHQKQLETLKQKQQWGDENILQEEKEAIRMKGIHNNDSEKYIAVFDCFFERNGLALITNILTGAALDLKVHQAKRKQEWNVLKKKLDQSDDKDDPEALDELLDRLEYRMQQVNLDDGGDHDYLLLPTLTIATQAIQSVSILVQNVSRATSLFFILSNNHVNQLINFPLEQYHVAERKKHNQQANGMSPRRFGSPELAELTTHFVTFLKSLALRMNIETLQFFLTYPADAAVEDWAATSEIVELLEDPSPENPQDIWGNDRPLDEVNQNSYTPRKSPSRPVAVKTVQVEFPLYERALEFCSAHQDSFVRVTAMNICLNTLRLATVQPESGSEAEEKEEQADDDGGGASISSPDGVLHNAKALPLRERLAIAQYVCSPSRVERLASPIFTKLAQLWGMLEEQFREMDAPPASVRQEDQASDNLVGRGRRKAANEKVARAKEKARRKKSTDSFNDSAFSIQDELLLLEDVLKVGLTSLNEQTIEMMFATFVYPLLLQPLLLYFQRSPVPDEVLFADPLNDHSAGREIKDSDLTAGEKSLIAAPAKSAFFCLAAVFQFITNQPLLRLLFTALLHPLAPDSTGETMIRAKADVACMGPDGKVSIRIDPLDENNHMKTLTNRSTYEFGTVTGKKCISGNSAYLEEDGNTCVFVLSPALAEILEFRGESAALVARTRHNPYRKAVFKCFSLCSQLSDLRPLSVLAVDSAVSMFGERFLADILFGLDLKTFGDSMPVDEVKSGSHLAEIDDRGMGSGPNLNESRLSLGAPTAGKLGFDHMNEVLSSFRSCLIKAVPGGRGTWKLEYDLVAAHALLSVIRGDRKAIFDAAKGLDRRCRQAAAFLSDMPKTVEKCGGEKLQEWVQNLSKEQSKDDTKIQGLVMDLIFKGYATFGDSLSVFNDLIELKAAHRVDDKSGHSVSIACMGSYNIMRSRCCQPPPMDSELDESALKNAIESARAWAKIDSFSTLLNSLFATDGEGLRNRIIGGFAVKRDGSIVATNDPNTVYAHISEFFWTTLFGEDKDDGYFDARPGRIVSLVGHTAFPCVCEVPPSSAPLFSEAGAKVVSQGITWQSLYLVVLGRNLVLAEPERKSSGDGRVVTCCKLERLLVEKDTADVRSDTSARRLIISHDAPEISPPGLFLFEETPSIQEEGPFVRLKSWRSSLDVWFEDNKAVELAFSKVENMIEEGKAYRGRRIKKYLAQGEGSGYPMDIPLYTSTLADTI